ncbi:thioredoxin-like protein [Jimgerdemannia flammicorona]|uniref:Thioredoxin-like protein n=1 Tax=Jimgerdemannia flammicorona TaxID=994334 RepID=A0A433BJW2_9FUNG|nr:thioredoxin-like protein [Jimgerdemannia flammicorona]
MSSNLIEITSDPQFTELITDKANVLVLNFWASWAEPCKQMNDVFAELASKSPSLKFLKIEAESYPDISEAFEVAAVPFFVVHKNGKIVDRVEGAKAAELTAVVEKYTKTATSKATHSVAGAATTGPKKDLTARLTALVNSAPVMAFIKGTPSEPRCGFSRQLVDILAEQQVKYSSFNILADDEVRQGLKTFSNWPTFPQIYINGELVGGLDIVKELIASGEFRNMLPKDDDLPTRLNKLIAREPVMIFIKGTPSAPRCGFSKQLVNILNEKNVKYGHFDILSDEEVRQGLKTHVNWPTFPMLFYKSELLGGLDIVKELVASGEFDQAIAA